MQQQHRQDQSFVFSQIMAQRLSILQMGQIKLALLIERAAKHNPMIDSSKLPRPGRSAAGLISPEEISETLQQEERLYDKVKEDLLFDWEDGDAELLYLILGSLDAGGFLGMDGVALCKDTPFDGERTEFLRKKIMQGSYPGLAAKDAKEYYLYSAKEHYGEGSPAYKAALLIYKQNKKITPAQAAEALGISEESARRAFADLARLSSSPLGKEAAVLIPDFSVQIKEGRLNVSPIRSLKPGVLIPSGEGYSPEEIQNFRKEAQALIDAVADREEALQRHAEALILARSDFFLNDAAAPIVGLKEIAAITGRHMSTVSRALKGRSFVFNRAIYPFSILRSHEVGGKSHTLIENGLQSIVEGEDKSMPLSDGEIQKILNKRGFRIARRTVAKYREKLGIPGMYHRKQK